MQAPRLILVTMRGQTLNALPFAQLQEGPGGGLSDSVDAATWPQLPHPGKDSVAKMTWDGLSFVVSVRLPSSSFKP